MAPGPFRRKPLGLDVPRNPTPDSPPGIAALFVIRFDIKAGYIISWKRTVPGVEIEGVVEYKSLPSGLHNVSEDLVYFVHEQYAGISSFVNQPADEAERNAQMFAVGVLVPLSFGRLGKSWRHAPRLKELAETYAKDMTNTQPLSDYWDNFEIRVNDASAMSADSPLESPVSLRFRERPDNLQRNRAFSDAIVLEASRPALTPFHPASSLPEFLDSFGPLILPLYRAALLRKRILFMAEAPVHIPLYDLSLLASLPNYLLPLLPPGPSLPPRPRALFNIGIHDIPYLSSFVNVSPKTEPNAAWIACSTDSVLSMKSELFDVLVTLPPPHASNAAQKVFPKISVLPNRSAQHNSSQAIYLKATQRDARRYTILCKSLHHIAHDDTASGEDEDSDAASTYSSSPVVEPLSWTRLAYTSFIWWASAGEKRDGLTEEVEEERQIEQDTRLLASLEAMPTPSSGSLGRHSMQAEDASQPPEIALVAYFRRLTTQLFVTLSDVIARQDGGNGEQDEDVGAPYEDEPEEADAEPSISIGREASQEDDSRRPLLPSGAKSSPEDDEPVTITSEDMTEMGLDVWSASDRVFVEELVQSWWGRKAYIDSARIKCCGISIV
ncbi:hypothetical protein CNMCM6936_002144 [Aspergillus lentulus]|uniref:DUF4484 domain-containing protein n=1 Tax=Aspergillus lentulus TaxID=293939 RepID=A0AAN6BTM9_ASPLE|nr:hypothetical protein CNMCM6936_002144 [Aspergillus lentulus]KAF4172576.1 hypothetical protein CNMCM8060_001327 [Aspergillus lentulus]KAF4180098.1 hypothetical protein CNMCM7927_001435 [Aspergillus lentulus]KAF4191997.1 hypothetical protein CNMCM8694_001023 [Aspergillus lentulus]KAF4208884.1 hypothetical protein CNMCM8927_008107 [Aspergillus lentulus]